MSKLFIKSGLSFIDHRDTLYGDIKRHIFAVSHILESKDLSLGFGTYEVYIPGYMYTYINDHFTTFKAFTTLDDGISYKPTRIRLFDPKKQEWVG